MENLNLVQSNPSLKSVRSVIAVGLAMLFLTILSCATPTSPSAASWQAIDDHSTLEKSEPNVKHRANDGAEQNDEPVVMFGTHHGGLWALEPEIQGGGDVEFNWTWDSAGIGATIRSIAIAPYPDGTHDYYAVAGGGGILRMRAQDDVAGWIGPGITGTINWMRYGATEGGSGAVDVDR
ncbi:MAG: hypothetical protein U9R15_19055, partial [Chloroflexota bacterium]|nr:hypothetical protein [Chloroflexota bacterium]